jgi:hypothetical protein
MTVVAVREPRAPGGESAAALSPPASAVVPVAAPTAAAPFAELVRGLGHEMQRGEAVVREAVASARGRDLAPAELIALQAGVYRYSEAVDLASRLVDHATSGLKAVVQGQ